MKEFALWKKVLLFLAAGILTLIAGTIGLITVAGAELGLYTSGQQTLVEEVYESQVGNAYQKDSTGTREQNYERNEELRFYTDATRTIYQMRYANIVILVISIILGLLCYVWLFSMLGHRSAGDEPRGNRETSIPFELASLIYLMVGVAVISVLVMFLQIFRNPVSLLILVLLGTITAGILFLLWLISIVVRVKAKRFWKSTLVYMILHAVHKLFIRISNRIGLVWKGLLVFGGILLFELLFLMIGATSGSLGTYIFLTFIEKLVLFAFFFCYLLGFQEIKEGIERLAGGELTHHVVLSGLYGSLRRMGENLNHLADGMNRAVEDRLKSERMKTELITNVSHDIKTPLTSIINYSDLIKKEPSENPKITEYAETLHRHSTKMKRLIEDLVEASKASTGNLEIHPEPCDASIFVNQIGGEFLEKLEAAQLTLVAETPEQEVMIMADSRRMWRVFDNLMQNICKYSLEGSRVYIRLTVSGGMAIVEFKNTSREQLEKSGEELMERFVREDLSRNTEGNGLGLAIARSLMELQNGRLDIVTDGDLFKAVLSMPLAQEGEMSE